jgi:hypothetical protein
MKLILDPTVSFSTVEVDQKGGDDDDWPGNGGH